MYKTINAACLMANFFDVCPSVHYFQLNKIGEIGEIIENELKSKNIAVNWSKPSVMEAFALYSDLFEMSDGRAKKSENFAHFSAAKFIEKEFNYNFLPDVISKMRETISKACNVA